MDKGALLGMFGCSGAMRILPQVSGLGFVITADYGVPMGSKAPLIIVGGGLAGALSALMLAERRPDLPVLLLEAGASFGGNHTWSFFDKDIPQAAEHLIAALNPVRWPRHQVRFQGRERVLDMPYNAIGAPALNALVHKRLASTSWRLNCEVIQIDQESVTLASGERIEAQGVIDARGPDGPCPGLELGWQKFVGIEFAAATSNSECPVVMDATIPQYDGYRFVYVLPFAADRVLVEDTYYSDGPALDVPLIADRVRALAAERGIAGPELRQETGVLPILIGGDPDMFWPEHDPVPRLGLRGGFFHATTGYSLGLALRMAVALAERNDSFDSSSLSSWTRGRFIAHWRSMRFFRVINRMLFDAALPDERHRVFAHFYRLPPDLIARFFAGVPTANDKLQILSGRPPVQVSSALQALVRHAWPGGR
jgi:lycopene beta-cyclase